MLLKAAMPFNFSSPEYLSHHRTRKNRVSPVSRASLAHILIKQKALGLGWVEVVSSPTLPSCMRRDKLTNSHPVIIFD